MNLLKKAALLVAFSSVVGCAPPTLPAPEAEAQTQDVVEDSIPNGPLHFKSYEGSLAVIKDRETGCEYILFFNGYKTGAAISPRYSKSGGSIICDKD